MAARLNHALGHWQRTAGGLLVPGFDPASIGNWATWHKADSGITITGAGVSTWANQAPSGSGYDLTQGTDANRPTNPANQINGYPTVLGDGSNDFLEWTGAGLSIAQNIGGLTVFLALKMPDATSAQKGILGFSKGDSLTGGRANIGCSANTNPLELFHSGRRLDADSNQSVISAGNFYVPSLFSLYTSQFDWTNNDTFSWLNGQLKLSNTSFQAAGSTSNTASLRGRVLQTAAGTDSSASALAEMLIYQKACNADERLMVESYFAQKYNIARDYYICDGDSLTAGGTSVVTITPPQTWPWQFNLLLTPNGQAHHINDGVSGQTLTQMNTDAPSTIDALVFPSYVANKKLVIWGGTNDIKLGASAATTYDRLKTYLAARKSTGKYTSIIVMTSIARYDTGTSTDYTTTIQAYNDLIRAGWNGGSGELAGATYGVTNLVDLGADSRFDDVTDTQNTTNYQTDRTHLTATGYGIIASLVKTGLGL